MNRRFPAFWFVSIFAALSMALSGCGGETTPPATSKATSSAAPSSATSSAAATKASSSAATSAPSSATTSAATSAATSASAKAGAANTIKIVSSLPMTGSSLGQTQTIVNAIKMALEESNNKAGDFAIVYEALDDATAAKGAWDAAKEADNANKSVADSDIMVYIGTYNSGAAKVAIPILNKAGLAMISPANSYPGLTKPGKGEKDEPNIYYPSGKRNYSRVVPADDLQGPVGAAWAKEQGAKSVYILDDTELYGHGIAVLFADAAKKIGLEIKGGPEGIDTKASDYRALANKIKGTNPDLIYFGGITQNNAGKLLKDIRAVGIKAKFMGPDGIFEEAFLKDAGEAAEGSFITFGGVPADKMTGKGAEWYGKYKDKYKSEPEAYAAYGYEAAKVTLAAIAKAGKKDRAAIMDALMATKDYDGVLGKWSFDQNGDTSLTTMSGQVVKSGKFQFEKTLSAPQ